MTTPWVIHIIDDDEPVRTSLSFVLETLGFRVASFAGAEYFLKRDLPETGIVVSDVRMPGISGIKLTQLLKDGGSGMPVILITGHASAELRAEAKIVGAEAMLEKPVKLPVLLAEITRASERLSLAEELSSNSPIISS
jgi:two-component system, LuxR family, response regulator FixJ